MPIDPSIPLGVKQPDIISPAQLIALKNLQRQGQLQELQLAEQTRQVKNRNALLNLMQSPGAVDQQSGAPSAQAVSGAYGIDPAAGMELGQQRRVALAQLSAESQRKAALAEKQMGVKKDIGRTTVNAYDQALTVTGGNQEEALRAAIKARNQALDELWTSGQASMLGFSDQDKQQAYAQPPDIESLRAHVFTPEELQKRSAPQSSLGKLEADYKAGRISQKDYEDQKKKINAPTQSMIFAEGGGKFSLSPEAIDAAAARYRIDGTLPTNLGRGIQGAAATTKILNRAAELAHEAGDSAEEQRLRQIAGKANTQALGRLEAQKNLILAFEKTAVKNADIALAASEKADRTGSPALNRWILAGKKSIAGDVDVAKLDAAMTTFINEYARVTSSATGGGVTSDTARQEVRALLNSAQTKEQVRGVIEQLKLEMHNRKIAYAQQERELRADIVPPKDAKPSDKGDTDKAPQAALDYLKAHPEAAEQFKAKYGYLP